MRGNPLYETADLHQKGVTHQADITRMPLADNSYDVIIAHHVLEHIDNDRRAMRELFRLLTPGGVAVLSYPLNTSRQATYENPGVTTPSSGSRISAEMTTNAITAWISLIGWRRPALPWVMFRRPPTMR